MSYLNMDRELFNRIYHRIKEGNLKRLNQKLSEFALSLETIIMEEPPINIPERIITELSKSLSPDICRHYEINKQDLMINLSTIIPKDYKSPRKIETHKKNVLEGSIGEAYKQKDIVIVDTKKLMKYPSYINIDDKIKTEVIIPVIHFDDVIGIIVLDFYHRMNKSELIIFSFLGRLIRYITHNYYDTINRERKLNYVKTLPEQIYRGLDTTFDSFFQLINDVFGVKFISFWIYTSEGDEGLLILRHFFPQKLGNIEVKTEDFVFQIIPLSKSIYNKVISLGKPQVFQSNEAGLHNIKFLKKYSIEWFISFPIFLDNKVLGIINYTPFESYNDAYEADPISFNLKIIEINTYFQLFQFITKISNLYNIETFLGHYDSIFSRLIQFVDEKNSWDTLAEVIKDLMNSEGCSIFLKNDEKELALKGTTGLIGDPDYNEVKYKRGEGLTGYAFEQGETVIYFKDYSKEYKTTHTSKYREKISSSKKSDSIILVPFKNDTFEVIGLIRCNNKAHKKGFHYNRFTKEDANKLENICKLVSNIHLKMDIIKQFTHERERNIHSLHHELLSPVIGIKNHAEWFLHHINRNPSDKWDIQRIKKKFEDISQNSELIEVLVSSMGDLDKITITPVTINLLEIIRMCYSFFKPDLVINGIKLSWDYLELPQIMKADKLHILRVFYNLIRNAIKYHDDLEDSSYIHISSVITKNLLEISIEDNGIGINESEKSSIFIKFTRGTNAAQFFPEGTGLGLTYCKKIIEKHLGKIYVANHYKPTIIKFSLPII